MLRNNYLGETKTHYKLYKCGKNWAVMGISLFSLGLGMLVTSRPVSADVTATSASSSAVKVDAASASSSAAKADTTSASSSSAVKVDATNASSSATKADTTSASSSSAVKVDATSASSSATKAAATSASSSNAVKVDATNASSSATKAAATSASSSNAVKVDATSASSSSAVKAASTSASSSMLKSNEKYTVSSKVIVNKDNFDKYFNQNGSANNNYDKNTGIQTITDGSFQSGNVAFDGAIDVRNNFEIDGAINLGQVTSNAGFTGIADGIGFVFYKGDRNQVGGNGGNLGIYGVTDAFGWKIDTWFNDSKHTNTSQVLNGDYDDGHTNPYGAFITTDNNGYGTIDQQSAQNLVNSIEDNKFHNVKFIYTASNKEFKIILSTPNGDVTFSKTFEYDTTSPAYYFTIASSTGALPTHQAFRIDSMTYSPIQKAIINYVDDTTGKTIGTDSVTGGSGESIDYSTANQILAFQKQGYELVSDGFSKNATYDDDDTVDQIFEVHLTHGITQTIENKTLKETIHYVYNNNGKAADDYQATPLNFTRQVSTDAVTGEKTYGSWSADQSFA
ncbi:lectin-like domain-containing protein, partial [Lactiplantibacillus plantarum]